MTDGMGEAAPGERPGGMTIRGRLERVRRRALLLGMSGCFVFGAGLLGGASDAERLPLAIAGFLAILTGVILRLFGLRCPRCGGSVGPALAWPPRPARLPPDITRCPLCGVALDAEA
jgi:hypothetical protein